MRTKNKRSRELKKLERRNEIRTLVKRWGGKRWEEMKRKERWGGEKEGEMKKTENKKKSGKERRRIGERGDISWMWCDIINYGVLFYSVLYYTILYCPTRYSTTLHYTLLYCTILTLLYSTISHLSIRYSIILSYPILYYFILFYKVLYCTKVQHEEGMRCRLTCRACLFSVL